jgi:hypothetical protein
LANWNFASTDQQGKQKAKKQASKQASEGGMPSAQKQPTKAKEQKSKRKQKKNKQKSKSLLVCRCQIPPLFCSIRPVGFARIYQKKVVIHKVSLARLLFCFCFLLFFCFCQLLLGRWHLSLARLLARLLACSLLFAFCFESLVKFPL